MMFVLVKLERGIHPATKCRSCRDDLTIHSKTEELEESDEDGAIQALEKLSLIDPFDANRHRQLAELYSKRQLWELAVRERYAMLHLDPPDKAGAHYELAAVLHEAKDLQTAHGHVLQALEIAPLFDDGLELLLEIRDKITAEEDQ